MSITALSKALRREVVAAAAKRFNVAESAVVLADAERVTWGDAALGCPEPGMMYTQALVAGFRVVARAGAGRLVYHTNNGTNDGAGGELRVVTCPPAALQPGNPQR